MNDLAPLVQLSLPLPPSVNSIYRARSGTGRRFLSKDAQMYRQMVHYELYKAGCLRASVAYPVGILIRFFPKNKKKRDLDNLLKVLLDSFVKSEFLVDDAWVHEIWISRKNIFSDKLEVEFYTVEDFYEAISREVSALSGLLHDCDKSRE